MKVLQIVNTLGPGGAEKLVSQLSIGLNKRNVYTSVYVLKKSDKVFFDKELINNNVELKFSSRRSFYDLRHIIDLITHVNKLKPNIIHAHLSFALYYSSILRFIFSKRKLIFFYTEHSTANRRRKWVLFKLIDKLIYSSFNRIICISEDVKNQLDEWICFDNNRTITVYNGIDTSLFKASQPLPINNFGQFSSDDKIILCVGSMFPHKNQQIIIKALSRLDKNHKLILVGDGPLKEELMCLADKLKLSGRVFFLGLRADIERIYKVCDLFILSSTREGFGLVAAEAMASGVPVLVSDIPGINKIVGNIGFKFKVDDVDDLTNNITYILKNKKEVEHRVDAGLSFVEQFSINKMIDSYLKNYKLFIPVNFDV